MRRQRAYNPDKLGLGGKDVQEVMEDYLKANNYNTRKQYIVRAREVIK